MRLSDYSRGLSHHDWSLSREAHKAYIEETTSSIINLFYKLGKSRNKALVTSSNEHLIGNAISN